MRQHPPHTLSGWKPIITVDRTTGNSDFVDLITSIFEQLPYDDDHLFPAVYRRLYSVLKISGLDALVDLVHRASASPADRDVSLKMFATHLGSVVVSRMTDQQKDRFLPFNDVDIEPFSKGFKVVFRSLMTIRTNGEPLIWDGKPCYYSHRRPTVSINGVGKIVAFSKHAVQKTCERACNAWRTYGGLGDAYAFFADCMYFETCDIRGPARGGDRQRAITFFQDCFLDQWRAAVIAAPSEYFLRIIGLLPEHLTKHWYYRVGYCPIEVKGEFAVATTLLAPGFGATPEYALLERSHLSKEVKSEMLRRAKAQSYEYVSGALDYELVKWFHDNGIPQVCTLPGDVFARPDGARPRFAPIDSPMSDFYKLRELLRDAGSTQDAG